MNAREAMQALLDGKTLVEKFPECSENRIRIKGDDLEHKRVMWDWEKTNLILINLKYTSVKEEE